MPLLGAALGLMAVWLARANGPEVEVVLARCREALDWVTDSDLAPVTLVYEKCGATDGPGLHIQAANVGRESGTYLQHIVDRYESLAEWTVFSQAERPSYGYRGHRLGGGHLMAHVRFEDYVQGWARRAERPRFFVFSSVVLLKGDQLYHSVRQGYGSEQPLGSPETFDDNSACGPPADWAQWRAFPAWFADMVLALQQEQRAPFRGFGRADVERTFDVRPAHGVLFFAQGARFGLSREAIHSRPKSYYQHLLSHTDSPDPWAGYFLEWLWWYVVGGSPAPCGFEAGIVLAHQAWEAEVKSREALPLQFVPSGSGGSTNLVVSTSTNTSSVGGLIEAIGEGAVIIKGDGVLYVDTRTVVSGNSTANQFIVEPGALIVVLADIIITIEAQITQATVNIYNGRRFVVDTTEPVTISYTTFEGDGDLLVADPTNGVTGRRKFDPQAVQSAALTAFVGTVGSRMSTQPGQAADFRRSLAAYVVIYYCGTVISNVVDLRSGYALQLDTACQVTGQQWSNVIGTLNAYPGAVVQLLSVNASSRATYVGTLTNASAVAFDVEVGNATGAFTRALVVYDNPGSCTTTFSATIEGCASGYACSVSGGPYSGDSSKCAVSYTQSSTEGGGAPGGGLWGLLALLALVPLAGLGGLSLWHGGARRPSPNPDAMYYNPAYDGSASGYDGTYLAASTFYAYQPPPTPDHFV